MDGCVRDLDNEQKLVNTNIAQVTDLKDYEALPKKHFAVINGIDGQ